MLSSLSSNHPPLPMQQRYDIVLFGHADAYVNAYALIALEHMVDLYTYLQLAAKARDLQAVLDQAKAAFRRTFWLDDAGHFADWIDIQNVSRRYFYTDINYLGKNAEEQEGERRENKL